MPILRGLFRHHEGTVWQQLSDGIGGEFIGKEGWRNDKVVCEAGDWTVTVDLFAELGYKTEYIYTRFTTQLPNPDNFHFVIHHESLLDRVTAFLGANEVEVGDAAFDKMFSVRSHDQQRTQQLLSSAELRSLFETEPEIEVRLGPALGVDEPDPNNPHDELTLRVEGEVNDIERLERLFRLFSEILHGLSEIFPHIGDEKPPGE